MNKLIQKIEEIRGNLDGLRRHSLKETSTRTIVIDPILDSLGWDVRDPDKVQLEYPTVDGKSVDYALKINNKTVLLVEAKALDDLLNDVKAITQVVGYAANDGIVWCVLTNGVKWKIYRSVEQCPAPEKLMFEVSLDPREAEGISDQQLAQQMWRFSREEMAKGTLDDLGTDRKVRKALDTLMHDPPRKLLNLLQEATGDDNIKNQQVKESLTRILAERGVTPPIGSPPPGGINNPPVPPKKGGKWKDWNDALFSISNKELVKFFRNELETGVKEDLQRRTIFFRKRRWELWVSKDKAYVWQHGRFKADVEFWNNKIGNHIDAEPKNKDRCLRFYLSSGQDFRKFKEALDKDLISIDFL
jgi:hypothetical protein